MVHVNTVEHSVVYIIIWKKLEEVYPTFIWKKVQERVSAIAKYFHVTSLTDKV